MDQFTAQDIGGDHTEQIEQDEETNDSQPRNGEVPLQKIDRNLGHQGIKGTM
jgi:hypothetical protein